MVVVEVGPVVEATEALVALEGAAADTAVAVDAAVVAGLPAAEDRAAERVVPEEPAGPVADMAGAEGLVLWALRMRQTTSLPGS
jgi:hypothetical protein